MKQGETPGFPRFKGKERFHSICYPQSGFKIIGKNVAVSKIGWLKVKLHREIKGMVKTCAIKKTGNQWYIIFTCDQNISIPKNPVSSRTGIDLGLERFAVLSDGTPIENPRYLRKCEQRLQELQSTYAKHKSHATKKRLSALHQKVKNQRNDFLHKTSRLLVNSYGLIAYEDLNIKNRSRRCKPLPNEDGSFAPNGQSAKSGLNKSIYDAPWGKFIAMVIYKVEDTGKYAIAVNPGNTSQVCSNCGTFLRKELRQRSHDCPVCGLFVHRDLNASYNILPLGTDRVKEAYA